MSDKELIQEEVRSLRFNVGTDEMTDEMIADAILETLTENNRLRPQGE